MGEVLDANIEQEMQSSYLDYAMSVIVGRALPDARDGLKPVQRRILYAMYALNNLHNQPTKKSARIVGECFVKDTLVLTDKGLIPIQDVQKGSKVYTQNGTQEVSELYEMPRRKLIKIKLENGTENVVTKSQQFKVLTKDWKLIWKEAWDLNLGDYILTKSFYPEVEQNAKVGDRELNENIGYLLGQLLSDGFVINDDEKNKYHRIGFCSTSIEIINSIRSCLEKEFNYIPTLEEKHIEYLSINGQVSVSKIYQFRINNSKINAFFIQSFDLLGKKAWSKSIPNQIFKSPKNVIYAFLSGLIDGDGYIHNSRTIIEYSTTSKQIANQLILLLEHLDIHGKKYNVKINDNEYILGRKVLNRHESFSLEFSGINAQRLAACLNLREEKKKKRARELLNHELKRSHHDLLPWASEKIFSELSKHHLGGGWYLDAEGEKFREGIKYPGGKKIRYSTDLFNLPLTISQIIEFGIKNKLKRINSDIYPFIEEIIRDHIYFSTVVTIEDAGEEITYDIQVANRHELIANGMIAHNCLGKFHPHGDSAVYEALVRMAQWFSLNHTLVEGQGNMGSIDGDPPAAQRYTEVRLNTIAEQMLSDIEKETVQFVPNFDNTETEPLTLPSMIPNLLLNGASGIAVGVATNILPHNLNELSDAISAYIDNPDISPQDIAKHIKGPDFPTGGIVFYNENLLASYITGKGSVTIRSKIEEEKNKNKVSLIVKEVPYNVNKASMVEQIARLAKDKKIIGISDIRDESGKEGIRVVIELKSDAPTEFVLNQLYSHSQLEVTIPVMNNAVIGNRLATLNLKQAIKIFVEYRLDVIKKRTQYDLRIASERLHIVEGLIKAIADIDKVVETIKRSSDVKEARTKLIEIFELSEKQANAVLDMRLSRLTNLEKGSLENERSELGKNIIRYNEILSNDTFVYQIIKDETAKIREKYGKERKTAIEAPPPDYSITREDLITDELVSVILTRNSYVKRINAREYREQERGGKGSIAIKLKEGDIPKQMLTCMSKDYLLILTNKGRAYWLKAYQIPEEGRYGSGKSIANLISLNDGEKAERVINTRMFEGSYLTLITLSGTIKKMRAEKFSRPRSNGIKAISLMPGDSLADACLSNGSSEIIIITRKGKALRFPESKLRAISRTAHGVRGIRLSGDDNVINILPVNGEDVVATITSKGYGKVTQVSEYRLQGRGGKGVINVRLNEKSGVAVKALNVSKDEDVLLISSSGVSIRFSVSEIRQTARNATGVRLMRVGPGEHVADAQLIPSVDIQPVQ